MLQFWYPSWQQDKYYKHCRNWSMQITCLPEIVNGTLVSVHLCVLLWKGPYLNSQSDPRKGLKPTEPRWVEVSAQTHGPPVLWCFSSILVASHGLSVFSHHLSPTLFTPLLWFLFVLPPLVAFLSLFSLAFLPLLLHIYCEDRYHLILKSSVILFWLADQSHVF